MGFYHESITVNDFREILRTTEAQLIQAGIFCGHGYESPHDEAVALVLSAAGLAMATEVDILDETYPQDAWSRLQQFITRRTTRREPTAYILGQGWLGPLAFKVDNRALIPRSPLMSVIESGFTPWWQGDDPRVIVDLCCGGGGLGLLAAWAFPESQVLLLDIDPLALDLAAENRALHQLTNAHCQQADLLRPLAPSSIDIIIANPPYVDVEELSNLPAEYAYEPVLALEAGLDGLDLVHQLMQQACHVLNTDGLLFLEVGNAWVALEQHYPRFPFTWLALECGGHGVCVLSKADLMTLFSETSTVV